MRTKTLNQIAQEAHSGTCPSDWSVFAPFADMCSCGCNRVSKLDSVHNTAVGIVPLYLCRYCKGTQTRQRKQNKAIIKGNDNHLIELVEKGVNKI